MPRPAIPFCPDLTRLSQTKTASFAPHPGKRPQIDWDRCEQAAQAMRGWIESHLVRFQLMPRWDGRRLYVAALKPLGELSILLSVLTSPAHREAHSPFVTWAERIAEKLAEHAEKIAEYLDWKGLIESSRLYPQIGLAMLFYPLLGAVVSRRWTFHNEIIDLLRPPFSEAQERTYRRHMDFQFFCDLMGLANSTPSLLAQLEQILLKRDQNPLLFSSSSLYALTHAVFYVTKFGRRPPEVLGKSRTWLRTHLGEGLQEGGVIADRELQIGN